MKMINFSFGSPDHGWLIVEMACNQNHRILDVSDVPPDSLYLLATAVLQLVEGRSTEALVAWSLEPDYETWFLRRSGDTNEFDIRAPGPDKKTGIDSIAAENAARSWVRVSRCGLW